MYAIVESGMDGVYGVRTRQTRDGAKKLAIKLFKEQYTDSTHTEEHIARRVEYAEHDLEKHGSALVGDWVVSIMTISKG